MLQVLAIISVRHSYRIQFDPCLMGWNCLRFLHAGVNPDSQSSRHISSGVGKFPNKSVLNIRKTCYSFSARIKQQKEDCFSTVHQAHYYIAYFLVFGGLFHHSLKLLFDLVVHHDLSELSVLRALNTFVTACNSINLGPRVVLLVPLSFY